VEAGKDMIELITGTPGAGKTTYAVAARVAKEVGREIALEDETCIALGLEPGTKVKRRVVVAGIKGLVIEHERLPHLLTKDPSSPVEVAEWNRMQEVFDAATGKKLESDEPVHQRLSNEHPKDVPAIMQNWWLWCRPGDLIVIDEAQFVMPRGSLGRKPPYWLQAMEIHRHYGVDFLLITQHPQLIDTTVRALVGMHRHVRSVMGSPVCMVYSWDHASNPERYNMATKATFVRRLSHYALFRSAAAHVKAPSSGRWGLIAAPLLLAIGGVVMASKLSSGGDGSTAVRGAASAPQAARMGKRPASAPGMVLSAPPSGVRGCYAYRDKCQCIGELGQLVRVPVTVCEVSSRGFDGLVKWAPNQSRRYEEPSDLARAAALAAGASAPASVLPKLF
jgi:zona occludens toxin